MTKTKTAAAEIMVAENAKTVAEKSDQELILRASDVVPHTNLDVPMGFEDVGPGDYTLPRIRILHKSSHECEETDPLYIEQAKMGMFIDGITRELFTSLTVVPCKFINDWVERVPGKVQGSFVKSHGADSSLTRTCTQDEKKRWILPNKNQLDQHAVWFLYLVEGRYPDGTVVNIHRYGILTLRSTQLRTSRDWVARGKALVDYDDRGIPRPANMFDAYYKLGTMPQRNDEGAWALLTFTFVNMVKNHPHAEFLKDAVYQCYLDAMERLNKGVAASISKESVESSGDDEIPF